MSLQTSNGKRQLSKYIWYAVIIALSFGIYWRLNHLTDNQVRFLLDFYKDAVELFFGNSHYFWEEWAYNDEDIWALTGASYYMGEGYNIGVNCLGLSIIPLLFGTCGLRGIMFTRGFKRVLVLPVSAVLSVALGVFANILRLTSSIYCITFAKFELIHAALGIVIYLTAVILCYTFIGKVLAPKDKEAAL